MKKSRIINITLVLLLLIGLSLLLYPSFSDYWNKSVQTRAIAIYSEQIGNIHEDIYADVISAAQEWNLKRAGEEALEKILTDEQEEEYNSLLNPMNNGMMGYIEIPSISVFLPIYHGTEDSVLQIAIGHLDWSSLPVGGESTHAVLSGHRGLPSALLFSDLDKLTVGDTFEITVLGKTLVYSVDLINVVKPSDLRALKVFEGKDYVTLVTCTPYGINTHRLLVRGQRMENIPDDVLHFTSEAMIVDSKIVSIIIAAPVLLLLLIYVMLFGGNSPEAERERIKRAALKAMHGNSGLQIEGVSSDPDEEWTIDKKK